MKSRRETRRWVSSAPPASPYVPPAPPISVKRSLGRRLSDELRGASAAARGLLLVRFFFGLTFIYAGLDKLLDPNFFNPAAATSIQAQFAIFERVSPLAPLVRLAEPFAVPLGVLIALGELGAGIGALTGLCFRLAALGGAALSLTFYLTASWSTQPYYLGPDLPYAAGWFALLIAGHGGLWVPRPVRAFPTYAPEIGERELASDETRIGRRQVVQLVALSGLTLVIGSAAATLRSLLPGAATAAATPSPSRALPSSTPPASATPAATAAQSSSPAAGGAIPITNVSAFENKSFFEFDVPITAPAALFPGHPALIVGLPDGTFAAFDAVCTHEGCTVGYDTKTRILLCPCHGAEFDPADHASVVQGPARQPLPELPLTIDPVSGTIALATR